MVAPSADDNICGRSLTVFLDTIESFHGWRAPGLVLGGFMVDWAQELVRHHFGPDIEADAIVETRHCLPDAIQLFTPCTYGNGWMKVLDWDKFALCLYDKHSLDGFRVWFDLEKAKTYPNLYKWYLQLIPKKELPLDDLLALILEARRQVLSYGPVKITQYYKANKKAEISVCPECGEAYSASQGKRCLACQGQGYYLKQH